MSKLTEFESKVLDFIKIQGEVQISNIPMRMLGSIPKLKNTGLVETFRKKTNPWASKKQKFVKALDQ
jgi:hypothetical protein